MNAHQKREDKKKENPRASKAKAKAKGKAKAKAKVVKDAAVCKTPSKSKLPPKGSPQSSAKIPAPPQSGDGTSHWKGGKIHRSDRARCWRVFIKSTDRNDKKVLWHDDEVASFKRALSIIEQGQ